MPITRSRFSKPQAVRSSLPSSRLSSAPSTALRKAFSPPAMRPTIRSGATPKVGVTTSRAVIRSRSMVSGLRVSVVMLSKLIPNALSFPSVRFCGLYRPGGAGRTVYRRPFPDRDGGLYRTDCIVVSYFFFVN